jgi:DNA polymerase-1
MVEKLITTYLNPIPRLAQHWSDGKVRFHYNQLGARTGRFTSGGVWKFYENEEPVTISGLNGQNLPSENHEIRLIFKAEPGRIFVGGDISQQEPKITAHISQDPNMLAVFREGKDIYASIAQSIFHNKYEDNLEFFDPEKTKINLEGKKRRKVGKVIILATMYGMSAGTVARKLKLKDKDEAQAMIDAYYSQFPDVKAAIETSIRDCKKNGFIEDICGRRRRLPSIQLSLYETQFTGAPSQEDIIAERNLRIYLEDKGRLTKEELEDLRTRVKANKIVIISNDEFIQRAERQTFNARIQGGAATLTKMMMIMVARDPLIKKLGGRIVFQIHDELILDCPEENADAMKKRLQRLMEVSSTNVGVVLPMKCDMTTETRWGEETMTLELKTRHQELIEEGAEDPLKVLCEEFCNFPEESIRQIICSDNEILAFEW